MQTNALEMAADIFAQVLRARTARYGELAPECASSYYRYGSVLLYQAQDNADVFGANLDTDVHQDVENKENHESEEKLEGPSSGSKGMHAASEGEAEEGKPGGSGGTKIEAETVGEATDLEIAWENLDAARAIWERDPQEYCHDLASVHVLLGDVALENEAFNDSLVDYDQALKYQKMAKYPEDDRRVAEVFFKRVMALQFLERPEDALVDVGNAQVILEKRLKNLRDGTEENKGEIDDVTAILDDLNDKKGELEAQAKEKKAMADAVRGALSHFHQQTKTDEAPQNELKGTSKSNMASPVKDLGVVGRGTKRINLAPVPANGQAPDTTKDSTEDAPEASKKPKRTMEDLMGGNGETDIGFGN